MLYIHIAGHIQLTAICIIESRAPWPQYNEIRLGLKKTGRSEHCSRGHCGAVYGHGKRAL